MRKLENIFDPIQAELDQKVFAGITPRESTLRFIQHTLNKALERRFRQPPSNLLENLFITGSLTTYQWSETSDLDISLFPNYNLFGDPNVARKQIIALCIDRLDGTMVPGTTHPIQYFVVEPGIKPEDKFQSGIRSGFDILNDTWIVPPEKDRVHEIESEFPEMYIRASEMADKMREMLDHDPQAAKQLFKQIHRKRHQDQQAGLGDFSEGNVVYKFLLHQGLFDRLRSELGIYIGKKEAAPMDFVQSPSGLLEPQWTGISTILFADMKGFTELCEREMPQSAAQIVGECMRRAETIINQTGGISYPSGGDSILAVFSRQNHADAAIKAGIELQQQFVHQVWRVGIHTGEVVVGEQIIGDTVNIASRLESMAVPGHVLISENTFNESSKTYRADYVGQLALKGRASPVGAYHLEIPSTNKIGAFNPIDYQDNIIHVIYDFEKDTIILGTRVEAAQLPPSNKIIGEYNNTDVTLYNVSQQWLNPKHFRRLWFHSFPDRKLDNIFEEKEGEHIKISIIKKNKWNYNQAFIWIDGEVYAGGYMHETLLKQFVAERFNGDWSEAWEYLAKIPMLPGHTAYWNIPYYTEVDTEEDFEDKYKTGELIAVFWSHFMQGRWTPEQMRGYKERALKDLQAFFPGIREATWKEHYMYNDPSSGSPWFTGVNIEKEKFAKIAALRPNEVKAIIDWWDYEWADPWRMKEYVKDAIAKVPNPVLIKYLAALEDSESEAQMGNNTYDFIASLTPKAKQAQALRLIAEEIANDQNYISYDYHSAFIYLGAPLNRLLWDGYTGEHMDLISDFVAERINSVRSSPDFFELNWEEQEEREAVEQARVETELYSTPMAFGHLGYRFSPLGTNIIAVFYTDFLQDQVNAQALKAKALKLLSLEVGETVTAPEDYGDPYWFGGGGGKFGATPQYVDPYIFDLKGDEMHGIESDCPNPKCNYILSDADKSIIDASEGWWTCPSCDYTYNYYQNKYKEYRPGGWTHAGLTVERMGRLGEEIIERLPEIPGIGSISWKADQYNYPIDFVIGPYAVEVKTNHSEAQPRFKLGGRAEREAKIQLAKEMGLREGLLGVRLNFYTDEADIFFREGFSDTWIGSPKLIHIATIDFSDLNPFPTPEQVPPPNELPADDDDWSEGNLTTLSWYASHPESTYLVTRETPYWGFRWAYYKGDLMIEDGKYGMNTHPDMAIALNALDYEEDDYFNMRPGLEVGYGTIDTKNNILTLIGYSADLGDFYPSSKAVEAIKNHYTQYKIEEVVIEQ